MVSRREFEQERMGTFATNLFWALDSWVTSFRREFDSLRRKRGNTRSVQDREELEAALRHGFMMRVSRLSLIVNEAYRRLFACRERTIPQEREEVHLNNAIDEIVRYHSPFLETMGCSITVSDSTQVSILTEKEKSDSPFQYLIWWILDAWPDSHITINFFVDEEKVRIIFQDPNRIHTQREYKDDHGNLLVWSCIIEHLIAVEYHGWCIWPRSGEPCKLEAILPLRPPTAEELDAPLPEWIR